MEETSLTVVAALLEYPGIEEDDEVVAVALSDELRAPSEPEL